MPVIFADNVSYAVRDFQILNGVSLHVDRGEFVGVIGPNGSGKSTLLKNIYKILEPTSGKIFINEKEVGGITNRRMANTLAVVAQESEANFDFTVEEVVSMGRYPRKKLLDALSDDDKEIVSAAIKEVGMECFIGHSFLELSGGEKQRTYIARALAQQTEIIVLDEPTNHLDIASQLSTLNMLKHSGKTILAALHDLTTAANYCDRIYAIQQGRIICGGTPDEVITNGLIHDMYGLHADVFTHNNKTFVDYS